MSFRLPTLPLPDYWQFSLHFPLDFILSLPLRLMPSSFLYEKHFSFLLIVHFLRRGEKHKRLREKCASHPRLLCFMLLLVFHTTPELRCSDAGWSVSECCFVLLFSLLSYGVDMESVGGLLYLMSAICIRWKISSLTPLSVGVCLFLRLHRTTFNKCIGWKERKSIFVFYDSVMGIFSFLVSLSHHITCCWRIFN